MIDDTIYKLLTISCREKVFADVPGDLAVYPAVVYDIVDSVDNYTIDGSISDTVSRVQIDVRSKTRKESKDISESIIGSLSGYRGLVDGIKIDLIKFADRRTIVTKVNQGLGIYRIILDFIVHH